MNYKDRLKRYDEERKRRNQAAKASGSSAAYPLTDPTNPASVYYQSQTNVFYSDGSYSSDNCESSSGSSSYDSGSSSSSSDCGGSYGE